jgi:hypothetical protein
MLSSHSQTSRQALVSDRDGSEESTHVRGVIDVDSDHITELSDCEEGAACSTQMSEDEESEEDEEAELSKSLHELRDDMLTLGQQGNYQKIG